MPIKKKRYSLAIERRLLACYYRADSFDLSEGQSWYNRANEIAKTMATNHGLNYMQTCGVIAALSPGLAWEFNIRHAEMLIEAYQAGLRGNQLPTVGTYGRKNVVKCIKILEGALPLDVLGGKKVRNFFANVLEPDTANFVTVDRHAKCAAYGVKSSDNSLVRDSEYEYIGSHYVKASTRVGLLPHQFQAIVWLVWRRLDGNLNQIDLDLVGESEVPF